MSVRQYIGARYVTKIYENTLDPSSAEWQAGVSYEPLILVTYLNGSYLSKKAVPGAIGDPAANPTYWAQTGFYNGQIAGLQAQIDEINNTLYIVGPDAKYQTITAAYNDCVANGGGVILITAGVYDEYIVGGIVTVPITFLGTDRKRSIWKSSTGGYDYAPFTGGGNLTFENLTLYKEAPLSQTVEGGYALHFDYPGATGQMNVINCDLISEENAALGCGTRTNQEIYVEGCYLETDLKNGIASTNGAMLYHTAPEASQTGQKFSLINCIVKSSAVIANILNSAANTENVPIRVLNNTFCSSDPAYSQDKGTFEQAFGWVDDTGNSHFDYTVNELSGNNCNTFNANKRSLTFNTALVTNAGYGFMITGSFLDSDLYNGFVQVPDTNTVEQPDPNNPAYYYGFVIGSGPLNFMSKTIFLFNYMSGAAYKKVIRQGSVVLNWTSIDFGV